MSNKRPQDEYKGETPAMKRWKESVDNERSRQFLLGANSQQSSSSSSSSNISSSAHDEQFKKKVLKITPVFRTFTKNSYTIKNDRMIIRSFDQPLPNIEIKTNSQKIAQGTIDIYDRKNGDFKWSMLRSIASSFERNKQSDYLVISGNLRIWSSKYMLCKASPLFDKVINTHGSNSISLSMFDNSSHQSHQSLHVLLLFAILGGITFEYIPFIHAITIYRLAKFLEFGSVMDYLVDSPHLTNGFKACDEFPDLLDKLIKKHHKTLQLSGNLAAVGKLIFVRILEQLPANTPASVKGIIMEECIPSLSKNKNM